MNATYVVYRNGVQSVTFTTNSIVTNAGGSSGGWFPGGGFPGGGFPGGGGDGSQAAQDGNKRVAVN